MRWPDTFDVLFRLAMRSYVMGFNSFISNKHDKYQHSVNMCSPSKHIKCFKWALNCPRSLTNLVLRILFSLLHSVVDIQIYSYSQFSFAGEYWLQYLSDIIMISQVTWIHYNIILCTTYLQQNYTKYFPIGHRNKITFKSASWLYKSITSHSD